MSRHDRTINGIKYEDYPATKKEAILNDFKWFYTGQPCKSGHIAPRSTSKNDCYVCKALKNEAFSKTEKGKALAKRVKQKARALGKYDTPEYKKKKAESDKKYREKNKEELSAKQKIWREKNKDIIKVRQRKYQIKNRDKIQDKQREYYKTPRGIESAKKAQENYRKTEKYKIVQKRAKEKSRSIPEKKLIMDTRRRINQLIRSVKGTEKQATTEVLIGCDKETFKKHIGNQFVKGMSWDNRSVWDIDHIIPLNFFIKHFDFNDINIQKIAFHYSNTQPLFAKENRGKKDLIYIRSDTLKKNGRIIVDMDNPVFSLFVHLIEVEVKKKLEILKKTNTIENVGQLTVSVKKEFDKIVGA